MQLGMIGLGRMGANMVRRLLRGGHDCVVFDVRADAVKALSVDGAIGTSSYADFTGRLAAPRVIWLMIPAALVGSVIDELLPLLSRGDILIDGGNSHYREAITRAPMLAARGVHFVDVGTSGGIWGLDGGYCLMVGGDASAYERIKPLLHTLSPGASAAMDPSVTAPLGYLHCGASGAGHFVKMVHNGIEYGLMAAYAEGFNLLRKAGAGRQARAADAETAPLADAETYQFDFDLPAIAELWRHGSVVRSWMLDLMAHALAGDPDLAGYSGHVSDSGEGRWTIKAGVDLGVPLPVLAGALFSRFASRDEDLYANKVLSALRREFGGHVEASVRRTADGGQ